MYKPPKPLDPFDMEEYNIDTERQRKQLDADYRNARKEWMTQMMKNKQDVAKLFSMILSALSIESRDRVEAHPEWDHIYENMDPLRLWKRIHDTHAIDGDLSVPLVSRVKANFISLKQGELETLMGYNNRFTEAVRIYKAAISEDPEAAIQAYRYLIGLYPGRFGSFIACMENNPRNGI